MSISYITLPASLVLVLPFLTACAGMDDTQQRTLSGAGIGAGVGAIGSTITGGSTVGGAAVGAAVGAGGGYLYDKAKKK